MINCRVEFGNTQGTQNQDDSAKALMIEPRYNNGLVCTLPNCILTHGNNSYFDFPTKFLVQPNEIKFLEFDSSTDEDVRESEEDWESKLTKLASSRIAKR